MLSASFCAPLPLSSSSRLHPRVRVLVRMARRASHDQSASRVPKRAVRVPPPKRQRNSTPLHSQSEYHRAMQLAARVDKRAARAAFRAGTLATPEDGRLWLGWAQMEARAGRMDLAREVFRKGVEYDDANVRLLHAWAVEEDRAGETQVAHELFERCLQLQPGDGIVWQAYALSQERLGRIEDARELFQKGVEMDARNAFLWSAWGVMERRQERYEFASELFGKAVAINPRHVITLQAWAITMEKMGKLQEGDELFRRALGISPSAPTFQAYGLFEARRGKLQHARELFQNGADLDHDHAPIWHAWAVMEQKEGNYERARELFNRGVEAAPRSTAMLRAWASMELELGHIDKSRDWTVPRGVRGKGVERERRQSKYGEKKRAAKQISAVGENLKMLRLLIERRTDEDIKIVMKWLDGRAKQDRKLYDAITERKESDSRVVKEWIQRRSNSDIAAFNEWVADRYKKDSRIGVYLFNLDIPPSITAERVGKRGKEEKPAEWLKLSEKPSKELQKFDEQLYTKEDPLDYASGIYFLGQVAEGLVDRAALAFVLTTLTFALVGASVHLYSEGYSPSGDKAEDEAVDVSPPMGVDAHLYEEGGAESVADSSRWVKPQR